MRSNQYENFGRSRKHEAAFLLLLACSVSGVAMGQHEQVRLVSKGTLPEGIPNGEIACGSAASDDFRRVAFCHSADNLVANVQDQNAFADIYLVDRDAGTTVLVSRAIDDPNVAAMQAPEDPEPDLEVRVSGDGNTVLFLGTGARLWSGPLPSESQVFAFDVATGAVDLITRSIAVTTRGSNGPARDIRVSHDGRYVAFASESTDLVAGQIGAPSGGAVFLHDRATSTTRLVSRSASNPLLARVAGNPTLSDDGRWLAFDSHAPDIVAGSELEGATTQDVYLYDRSADSLQLVSHVPGAPAVQAGSSAGSIMAADGNRITFASSSAHVIDGQVDSNFEPDLFSWERSTDTIRLISRSAASAYATGNRGVDGTGMSNVPAYFVSDDGLRLAYTTRASDHPTGTPDTNGNIADVVHADLTSNVYRLLSRTAQGSAANGDTEVTSISSDGQRLALRSMATDIVAGFETQYFLDVLLVDAETGSIQSTEALVDQSLGPKPDDVQGRCGASIISQDEALVTCAERVGGSLSRNTALLVDFDATVAERFLVTDSSLPGIQATGGDLGQAGLRALSADGRSAVYRDGSKIMLGGPSSPVSRRIDTRWSDGAPSSGAAASPTISANGNHVAFLANADDLDPSIDDATATHLYRFDLGSGERRVVSLRPGLTTVADACLCHPIAFSADGDSLLFFSQQPRLAAGEVVSGRGWLLVHRFSDDSVRRLAFDQDVLSKYPTFADASLGRIVTELYASDAIPGVLDANNTSDVILIDVLAQTTSLVSSAIDSPSQTANAYSVPAGLSRDGRFALISTEATDFADDVLDTNGDPDLYVVDLDTDERTLITRQGGAEELIAADVGASGGKLSADGRWVFFESESTNLVPGFVTFGQRQVYLHDRQTGQTLPVSRHAGTGTGLAQGARIRSISDAGEFVVFSSASTDAVAGLQAAEAGSQFFRHDRIGGSTTLLTRAYSDRTLPVATAFDWVVQLDASGVTALFQSKSSLLQPGDTNGDDDVFLAKRLSADVVFRDGLEAY